jgi:D-tyrosyl-tRNA(Tyr) deacylase
MQVVAQRVTQGAAASFTAAAPPEVADALYQRYCREVAALGVPTAQGMFGAHMVIDLTADGPVTLRLSRE